MTKTQTTTRSYKNERAMRHGIQHMARSGWRVAGQSSYTPRKGLTRTLLGGFLFFNRKPVFDVTFTREK